MHGNGNDFILVDEFHSEVIPEERKSSWAQKVCRRRFSVGADGVIFLLPSETADVRMRLFNSDGSEAEMCGNGIRCLAKYAVEKGYASPPEISVETLAGVMKIRCRERNGRFFAKVRMGVPKFRCEEIPAICEGDFYEQNISGFRVHAVNTGVPHAVIFVEDVESIDVERVAPEIRHHPSFPKGANVNFVEIRGDSLVVRTFERGVEAETLSCGTGATASAAVARRLKLIENDEITVFTRGGELIISFEGDEAYMEGPAETAFKGEIEEW
ncbi:MAG: diaminopimelate epimerase [Archaeoglobi archaeon]|nr:diaminopimelate epimerase [Candidatus Mnemosynella bozhongmuii]MDI3503052.1 diaminopimelate epimerase [Archaeoglobi archaeon]MDK2782364.1 diaminopimelate epimerase [Archaeoglobi archaeon]